MCVANVFLYSFIRDHSTSYGGINKKKKILPSAAFHPFKIFNDIVTTSRIIQKKNSNCRPLGYFSNYAHLLLLHAKSDLSSAAE